jgi:predicted transcriptional regulator
MFVNEIMSKCVTECTEDTRLDEVYDRLRKCDHGIVVVVDSLAHRVPIGVVTERSICEQIIARGRNPRSLTAGSVMDSRVKKVVESDPVETIAAGSDDLTALVVVDRNRHACGIISKAKLKELPRAVPARVASVRAVPVAARPHPVRISEIPAFGWIQ